MQILVVQTAFLGDVVLTTPLLRELHRVHPRARLTVLTTRTGREALRDLRYVDRLLIFDKSWGVSGLRSFARLTRLLRSEAFDIAIGAQRSTRTGQLLWISGAPLRIGFEGAPGAWAYHRRVAWNGEAHAVRRYLDLASAVGGDPAGADPQPELGVDPGADARIAGLLEEEGIPAGQPFVCVAPGSRRRTKRWRPEGFAEVISAVEGNGMPVVLVGTMHERALCRRVASASGTSAVVLAGRTGVRELIALVARASVVLANDSGTAHVASAVGTPVVSVFGPTSPADGRSAFGALNRVVEHKELGCRPCGSHGHWICPRWHFRCMRDVGSEEVSARLLESMPRR
jgi:heptosyltransferase-2